MFKITKGNSKLGSIPAINLPAVTTCRADAPCKKGCYANRGTFLYKQVKACYEENLRMFLEEPEQAEQDILSQIPHYGMIRWTASGDIVNEEFFEMMIRIAKTAKGVKFLAFTKKYEIVNNYIANGGKIPSNLKIVFSGWLGLEMVNPYNLPTAYIKLKKGEEDIRIKKSAKGCEGNCTRCKGLCWELRKGQQVFFNQH